MQQIQMKDSNIDTNFFIPDVAVIGSGFSGLFSAVVAARRGKKVKIFTKGTGNLAIGGGTIDILGYSDSTKPISNPFAGIDQLDSNHPYKKIDKKLLEEASEFFLKFLEGKSFEYVGDLQTNKWLLTSVGTLKSSCFVPKTMDSDVLKSAKEILIVSFKGLKDYYHYSELVLKGLNKFFGINSLKTPNVNMIEIETGLTKERDISIIDIARFLETEEGLEYFKNKISSYVQENAVVIIPPVLGVNPNYKILENLEKSLKCRFLETIGFLPAVSGLRLRAAFIQELKELGVPIIENAFIIGADKEDEYISLVTKGIDKERKYKAKSVILATGGFLGGGIESSFDSINETVFKFPIKMLEDFSSLVADKIFCGAPQKYAKLGVSVNNDLNPINELSEVINKNVYVVGCNLEGYDYCFEKSGNGVALLSGYKAGMSV